MILMGHKQQRGNLYYVQNVIFPHCESQPVQALIMILLKKWPNEFGDLQRKLSKSLIYFVKVSHLLTPA